MATQHAVLSDPELHEPKGIASALSGQIYVSDGAGSGVWTTLDTSLTNVVQVDELSDLPDPVGSVITLAASTIYLFSAIVDIGGNRIEMSEDSLLVGIHRELCGISSSTTGVLIASSGADVRIQAMRFNAPTASKLVQFDGTGTKVLSIRDVVSTSHTGIAIDCTDAAAFIVDYCVFVGGTDVIKMFGSNGSGLFTTFSVMGYTGCGIDFGSATFTGGPTLDGVAVVGTGGVDKALCGAANNGNLATGDILARVKNSTLGGTQALDGIAEDDVQWVFDDVIGVSDTQRVAFVHSKGNTVTTSISGSNTPVKLNTDVAFTEVVAEHFETDTTGRVTYKGTLPRRFSLSATITGTCASGSQDFTFYAAKNGVVLTDVSTSREFNAGIINFVAIIGIFDLDEDDYIEMWVENDVNSNNFEVRDIAFDVQEV